MHGLRVDALFGLIEQDLPNNTTKPGPKPKKTFLRPVKSLGHVKLLQISINTYKELSLK